MIFILIGAFTHIVLFFFYKRLVDPKIYILLLGVTVILAFIGYQNLANEYLQLKGGHAAKAMFLPLLFMVFYWLLRQIFLLIFKNEPLMTKANSPSWDQGEYRRLHGGDAIFTVLNLTLPYLTIFLI